MKDTKQRLFEVMGRLDKTFKPKEMLNEWNFDKKKGEEDSEEKKEGDETPAEEKKEEHEESETPKEEKEEHEGGEEKKELDETKPKAKIPVNMIAKVGGK